mmetsp:Transcript_26705/g.73653  ORF Transcript_26705/g.73653 Transcript_26705/m.73653 type:complete len:397 (-) Transcript_26705:69-1259(-)
MGANATYVARTALPHRPTTLGVSLYVSVQVGRTICVGNDYVTFEVYLDFRPIVTESPTSSPSMDPTPFPSWYPTIAPSMTLTTASPASGPTQAPTTSPMATPPAETWKLLSNTGADTQCLILPDRPHCIQSSLTPPYDSNVACVFEVQEDGDLEVEFWDVEEVFDGFYYNAERTLRDTQDKIDGLAVAPGDILYWLSDRLGTKDGWLICLSGPTEAPTKAPSPSPTADPTKAPSQTPTLSPTQSPNEPIAAITTAVCSICFMPVPMPWSTAQIKAQDHACELASIETMEDVLTVSLDFSSHMIEEKYWVGGYFNDTDRSWYWSDGASFSGTHWAPGQPDRQSEEGVNGTVNATAVGREASGGGLISLYDEASNHGLRSIWKCCGGCPSVDTSLLFN